MSRAHLICVLALHKVLPPPLNRSVAQCTQYSDMIWEQTCWWYFGTPCFLRWRNECWNQVEKKYPNIGKMLENVMWLEWRPNVRNRRKSHSSLPALLAIKGYQKHITTSQFASLWKSVKGTIFQRTPKQRLLGVFSKRDQPILQDAMWWVELNLKLVLCYYGAI